MQLVSLNEQDSQGQTAQQGDTESSKDNPPDDAADDAKADSQEPAEEAPAKEEAPEKSDDGTAEPAAGKDESGDPATDEAESGKDVETVEPFEKVRDQVAADMVRPAAQARMAMALQNVTGQMKRFFSQNAMYENSVSIQGDTGKKAPERPNLAAIAAELGLQHEIIGSYSAATISSEPIAQSVSMDSLQMGQSSNFVQLAFGSTSTQSSEPSLSLFAPIETTDPRTMRQYLAWKIEEIAAYTPELEDVRDDVVYEIRKREARKLAIKSAQAIADQAKGKEASELKDLIPADKTDALQEGLGPFSWMTSFGFQGASLSVVPGVEAAGGEFMEAVFTNEPGSVSVAVDLSGNTVYVIQTDSFQPGIEELQEQFKQPTNRFMSMMLGNGAGEIVRGYFERMDDKSEYKDLTISNE